MGVYVFNNEIFDNWLNRKAEQILNKVDREAISTEEMIILILKAQTNHFFHIDHDLRSDIKSLRSEVHTEVNGLHNEIKDVRIELKSEIKDFRHDMHTHLMWMGGITAAGFAGIYLKLFLN